MNGKSHSFPVKRNQTKWTFIKCTASHVIFCQMWHTKLLYVVWFALTFYRFHWIYPLFLIVNWKCNKIQCQLQVEILQWYSQFDNCFWTVFPIFNSTLNDYSKIRKLNSLDLFFNFRQRNINKCTNENTINAKQSTNIDKEMTNTSMTL